MMKTNSMGQGQRAPFVVHTYSLQGRRASQYSAIQTGGFLKGENDPGTQSARLDPLEERAEMMYVILSFTAKTLLAWLILSPILAT